MRKFVLTDFACVVSGCGGSASTPPPRHPARVPEHPASRCPRIARSDARSRRSYPVMTPVYGGLDSEGCRLGADESGGLGNPRRDPVDGERFGGAERRGDRRAEPDRHLLVCRGLAADDRDAPR